MIHNAFYESKTQSGEDPIKTSWENVVLKGLEPDGMVRPEILRSWRRCRDVGLDPFSKSAPPVLSGIELDILLERNKQLLDVSKPVMDMIEISVRDTGFIFTLSEKEARVLVVRGDREILKMAEQNYYVPGCLRTVEHAGTNAIGLCLIERKPIQLTGTEHYKVSHHPWTCSSAPIFDNQGKIIGAITLSGRSTGRHRHTLALVSAAAETIETQLRERELIWEKQRLSSLLTRIFDSISDGLVAVDKKLSITRLNRTASEMLGLKGDSVVGRKLNEVIQAEDSLIRALKSREYFTGIETSFYCLQGQKSYICSVDPVRNNSGHILGALITLTEKRQMIGLAKRIGGNYAKYQFNDIKGNNSKLLKEKELAKIAARTNSRILIIGESGTGKELFAQAIHNYSKRKNEPFVAISCAAIPRDLIESELFGYRGGAFTGSRRDGQVGKFELANNGTLFLDEVNGLPLDLQSKLLRVLQQNEIMRLGDTRTTPVDVRVIAASNMDLMTEVESHNFREDFYYRLDVVEINIPPLRERMDDLALLINHIMERQCQEMNIRKPEVSDEVFKILNAYYWPGNVRELENSIERALLLSRGNTIQIVHLPDRLRNKPPFTGHRSISLMEGFKEMIVSTLDRCGGNVSLAAKELRIGRSTLYRKIKEFEIH
jgi:PAS domain S-box-containing protein